MTADPLELDPATREAMRKNSAAGNRLAAQDNVGKAIAAYNQAWAGGPTRSQVAASVQDVRPEPFINGPARPDSDPATARSTVREKRVSTGKRKERRTWNVESSIGMHRTHSGDRITSATVPIIRWLDRAESDVCVEFAVKEVR